MRYNILKRIFLLFMVVGAVNLQSCKDDWEEHYDDSPTEGADQSMTEYINSQPDLSIFASMLKNTGYDSILNTSQSYTVWAPSNEGLSDLDLSDERLVLNIVENHIIRSRVTTSGLTYSRIQMLSGKYVVFRNNASDYTFGGSKLSEPNQPVYNGLAHKLEGYAPYRNNIWEYIEFGENIDSVSKYLLSNDEYAFDAENSIEIGYNSDSLPIYDSVFTYQNLILNQIGSPELSNEDSVYTVIIPDNNAWNNAYNRISSYFNFPEVFGGEARQHEVSQFTLVQDMVFRGLVEEDVSSDYLISTYGNIFYNPSYLFDSSVKKLTSNGYVYQTNQMPFIDTTSWFNEIRVEAETTLTRTDANAVVTTKTSYTSDLDISNYKYIQVTPASTQNKPSCTFHIANTLSAKYNVYCVFVPESIVDETKQFESKVSFVLTYLRSEDGSRFKRLRLSSDDYVIQKNGLTKMLVTEIDFEFANVLDRSVAKNNIIVVKLEVINQVTNAEATEEGSELTRNMRIDAIILEPVSE